MINDEIGSSDELDKRKPETWIRLGISTNISQYHHSSTRRFHLSAPPTETSANRARRERVLISTRQTRKSSRERRDVHVDAAQKCAKRPRWCILAIFPSRNEPGDSANTRRTTTTLMIVCCVRQGFGRRIGHILLIRCHEKLKGVDGFFRCRRFS